MRFHFIDYEQMSAFLNDATDLAREYGRFSLQDACDLMNQPLYHRGDRQIGWTLTDIQNAKIEGEPGDLILVLPDPTQAEADDNEDEMVSHPPHYQSETGLEVIDVIEAFTLDLTGIEATDTGNIIKYACRWKKKGGVQDLKKIVWYANHLIDHIVKLEKEN